MLDGAASSTMDDKVVEEEEEEEEEDDDEEAEEPGDAGARPLPRLSWLPTLPSSEWSSGDVGLGCDRLRADDEEDDDDDEDEEEADPFMAGKVMPTAVRTGAFNNSSSACKSLNCISMTLPSSTALS